ncbi:MAG: hypothetical protein ACK5Z2_19325 [Bacteroidota bacterium]|jgi:hypothetical protein
MSDILEPTNLELILQIKHRVDKNGYDILTRPVDFSPADCYLYLKKNKWPWLYAGLLLKYNNIYWNAEYKDNSAVRFYIDYPKMSLEWINSYLKAINSPGQWIKFEYSERCIAKMSFTESNNIILISDNSEHVNNRPPLKIDSKLFGNKLLIFTTEMIEYTSAILSSLNRDEAKISSRFKKELEGSIKFHSWQELHEKLKII